MSRTWWPGVLRSPFQLYAVGFCLVTFLWLLRWPIFAGDTDIWFHLDYGRYLFEHRALPRTTFFSFLSPPRDVIDTSWLFQVVVYQLYSWWGYYGLIGLRAVLYLATSLLIFRYLFTYHNLQRSEGWLTFIGISGCLILLPRCLLVRPHLVDYFFIVLFLYLLDRRPARVTALPVLAILWCNLHGIAASVLLGITLSYSLDYFLNRLRGQASNTQEERRVLIPLVLSMLAIFLTPNGWRLLELMGVPAQSLEYESQVVSELRPFPWDALLSFQVLRLVPSSQTVFNLVVVLAGIALISAGVNKRLRVSHLLLCLGGMLLLTKGVRFLSECALLALPLLKANPLVAPGGLGRALAKPLALSLTEILLLMPVFYLPTVFANRPRYPSSSRNLPEGIVTFLDRIDAKGAVLNNPNTGGYLRWRLYPRYRIFMDMENPVPFTAEDLHLVLYVFVEGELLRRVLVRDEPSFISVPIPYLTRFEPLIARFPDYVLVFFDDFEALYLNQRHDPQLARQHALQEIHPFALFETALEAPLNDQERAVVKHLPRLLEWHPGGWVTNRLAARLYDAAGLYDRVLQHAEAIIDSFPESPTGHFLKGNALKALGLPKPALAAYRKALARAAPPERQPIYKAMSLAYLQQRQCGKAYRAFDRSLDAFALSTSREELYLLGTLARLAGKRRTAHAIFAYLADFKLAPDEVALAARLKDELRRLSPSAAHGSGPSDG